MSAIDRSATTTSATLLKLLPAVLAHAKSILAPVRLAATELVVILYGTADPADVSPAAELVAAPLKEKKTASPDHRATLFTILARLPADAGLSPDLVSLTLSLLPKETNDATISAMMRVLAAHLPAALSAGSSPPAAQLAALVKGMQEPKPAVRRAVHLTVGAVLWSLPPANASAAAVAFAEGVLPGLEHALKTVAANPLTAPAGSLEGYAAVAVIKGRLGRWGVKKICETSVRSRLMQRR